MYLVFHRLNTGSVPLSPQELRQALHPGPFLRFVSKYSESSSPLQRALGLDKPDFRMRDVELLVHYFAFRNRISSYAGNLEQFLDDTCKELKKAWADRSKTIQIKAGEFEAAVDAAFGVLGENAFRKWDGSDYERRFNRAVFDIMVYYFSDEPTRKKALARRTKVKAAFEHLCNTDTDFL